MAQTFHSGAQVVAALKAQDPVKIGSALSQLRQLCSTKPLPAVVLDYLQLEPAADSIFQVLNVAREANSIHLLANSLYTLSYLISRSPTSPFETRLIVDGSRIINHLVQNHSKSIHRCFAPGRTEATLACLTLLISCVSWNEGACAKIVIGELRWDHKTVTRLLQTRQTVTAPEGTALPSQKGNRSAPKLSKLKGQLHQVDIRTLMLRFIFSVVSSTELRSSSKQELWKTKGLAEGVLRGLQVDPYETVAFVLGNLWEDVTRGYTRHAESYNQNMLMHHSGWEIFDQNAITMLVQLLERDDPVKDIPTAKLDATETIAEMVERFLTTFTIYLAKLAPNNIFQQQANSRLPPYRILLNLVKCLSPTKSIRRWRLALHILESVPSLCFSLWRIASPPSEPSSNLAWISSVGFATKVASIPFTLSLKSQARSLIPVSMNNLTSIAKNLLAQCIPTPLNRAWFTRTLQYPNSLVSFSSLVLLLTGLKKARNISHQLENIIRSTTIDDSTITSDHWSKLLLAFHQSLQATLPDSQVLIAILQVASRRENEDKSAPVDPPDHSTDATQPDEGSIQQESDSGANMVAFSALAALLLYHELIPQTMCNLNFDYIKLIPTFFKLNLNEEFEESQSSSLLALHRLQSPIAYLCQSRTLLLIGNSALTNPTQPSPALVKVLLLLSSFHMSNKPENSDLAPHTPLIIKDIAQETLQSICKSIVPHLRDENEYEELCIWLSALSELRRVEDCVTPLVFFLEDCIRACLRHPLKYLQISEERRNISAQAMSNPRPPTLISALLVKVKAITKGSGTSSVNTSRLALISLVIKFLNLYLFMVLSTSHQTRPINMIYDISSQLSQIFSITLSSPTDNPSPYPDYFGNLIMNVLRSATQQVTFTKESGQKVSWPSYITQSIFSDQVAALNLMRQTFTSAGKTAKSSKSKKAVTFMDAGSTTAPTSLFQEGILSKNHQLGFIRFMTRAIEMEKSDLADVSFQLPEGGPINVEQLDYEVKASNIKALVGIISNSSNNNSVVIECFLEEMYHLAQVLAEKMDFELLLDILRASCPGIDTSNQQNIKVLIRYSDLISDSASFSLISDIKKGKLTAKINALIQCACYLFPAIDVIHQTKTLIALLSSMDPKILRDANCVSSLFQLLNIISGLPPQEKQCLLDQISIDPVIQALCDLSHTSNGKVATNLLLEIIERYPDSSKQSDDIPKSWPTSFCMGVFVHLPPETHDFATKLRIASYLARNNKKIALLGITWLNETTIDQLRLVWDGALSLLIACLESLPPDDKKSGSCTLPFSKHRLDELINTIGLCLFCVNPQTHIAAPKDGRETRMLASKSLKLLYPSRESLMEQLPADQIHQSGVIPANSQAFEVLSTCKSGHLNVYIDRCLCWLVRRFSEDESCCEDTAELVQSLHNFLRRKPAEYTLSPHLVNPVLTAALDRRLDDGCVMKLMNSFVCHTKLGEADALRHVRATVESRNFRSLMRPHQDKVEKDGLAMSVINKLVISYPIVAIQASLSKTLIPFYGGTMSLKDRLIFQILRVEDLWSETSEISAVMLAWKPIIGNSIASNHHLDVVALLDSKMVEATSTWVLSRRESDHLPSFPDYYDPSFLLALLLHFLQQDEPITMSVWHSITRSGLLGLAMCALSSKKIAWRFLGDRCLTKSYERLKTLDHTDASEILLPIEHFRNLHVAGEETQRIMSVPPLITLFLSRCLSLFCTAPESALHQPLSRFLLQRAVIDGKDVPMLYSLLYSSADLPSEGHLWLMQMLHDGLGTTIDWKIMNHRQTFEILITLVHSSTPRTVPKLRHLLLKLLRKAASHDQACIKLISKPGLLKVLEQLKPFSKREWKEVMNILQEVASRIPLFHHAISRETVENIIQLLTHFRQTEYCSNSSLVANSLVILRSLLVCSSFWLVAHRPRIFDDECESGLILLKVYHLSQSLSLPTESQSSLDIHKNLNLEIRARIQYLLQLH